MNRTRRNSRRERTYTRPTLRRRAQLKRVTRGFDVVVTDGQRSPE